MSSAKLTIIQFNLNKSYPLRVQISYIIGWKQHLQSKNYYFSKNILAQTNNIYYSKQRHEIEKMTR